MPNPKLELLQMILVKQLKKLKEVKLILKLIKMGILYSIGKVSFDSTKT